jgi:ADP-heptose:LPS heptosyltransferase
MLAEGKVVMAADRRKEVDRIVSKVSTQHQRRGRLAAALLIGVERFLRPMTVDGQAVRSVLLLEYRLPLGCVVHMTPVLEAIKRSRPVVEITIATRAIGLEVLRHSRFVDHLIDAPDPTTDFASAVLGLRKELRLRGLRPECVLTGASDQRTRIALMGLLGSSGWRGGYTQTCGLYHRPLVYDTAHSLIANNLRLGKLLACDAMITRPRVFFSSAAVNRAVELLHVANPCGRPVAIFATQNSGGQRTGWHIERFAAVIRHAAQRGFAVVHVGTAAEREAIDTIRIAADGIGTSVSGQTTVSELAALLAMSDVMVTLDTGPMHVGRAVGVPMVVLGPSWQRPVEWLPLGLQNVRILRGEDRADVPDDYRLDEISAESVIGALDELMQGYPPSKEARAERVREGLSEIDHLAVR